MATLQNLSILNWKKRCLKADPSLALGLWGTSYNKLFNLGLPVGLATFVNPTISDAILYNLSQITEAGGYNFTIVEINYPAKSYEQMKEFPAVNVFLDDARPNWTTGHYLCLKKILTFECFLRSMNEPETLQDEILADIQKRFGNYYWMPDLYGTALAANCVYLKSEPFGNRATLPMCGISIQFVMTYRQRLTNPYALN